MNNEKMPLMVSLGFHKRHYFFSTLFADEAHQAIASLTLIKA